MRHSRVDGQLAGAFLWNGRLGWCSDGGKGWTYHLTPENRYRGMGNPIDFGRHWRTHQRIHPRLDTDNKTTPGFGKKP